MKKIITTFFLLFAILSIKAQYPNHWETAIFASDTWQYFVGNSEPNDNWKKLDFDASNWSTGIGGFGFGDNDDGTIIPQTTSVYLRKKFNVADLSKLSQAILSIDYDDAFVAYINNQEIARSGITGNPPKHNQLGKNHEATGTPENFFIPDNKLKNILVKGENILAIQIHNSSVQSSDMSSNAFLSFGITDNSTFYRETPKWFSAPKEFATNLPLIIIDTEGGTIVDEPKITANMKIIHNPNEGLNKPTNTANIYDGKIGIEIRGHFSASFPQKPYGLETRDDAGEDLNVSLLGMPKESDWVLVPGYGDKTLLKNTLAYEAFREMGHYAPRFQHVEVIVNGNYQGIYFLGEKIKRDKNRVNISKLTKKDTGGDALTGGYIFKNDYAKAGEESIDSHYSPTNKPGAKVYFVFHDPKSRKLLQVQKDYLRNYIYEAETALYSDNFKNPKTGYRSYFDIPSFIDYMIVGEFSRNIDHYKKSRYFHKDKSSKSKLIYSGPVWDFDWAFKNLAENCHHFNQFDGSGWAYLINECVANPTPPSWEVRMLQDEQFANELNARYFSLRKTVLSNEHIFHKIDSVATLLDDAQKRHYDKWKILGKNVGAPDLDNQPTTFAGEIYKLKSWINKRLSWLDKNMLGESTSVNNIKYLAQLTLYPNPVKEMLHINSQIPITNVKLKSVTGQTIISTSVPNSNKTSFNISELPNGIYFVEILFEGDRSISEKIIIE